VSRVEPVPGSPAATVDTGAERVLAFADFHAGIEAGLRYETGVEVQSQADDRRATVTDLVERTDPDRVVVLGDFMHSIGGPGGAERGEVEVLLESLPVPVTVVRGNHDGAIDDWIEGATVTDGVGVRLGEVGFVHGHTWPAPEVLDTETVCVGHDHPVVRLTDAVGGSRAERVWLRGRLDPAPFLDHGGYEAILPGVTAPDLVVFPAFNDLSGGTWVNVEDDFLCPFMPEGLANGEAYLLDGTRLGAYGRV
jgi:putative SbcD/Mre11-related phosphoesterase